MFAYIRDRNLNYSKAGAQLGRSREWVRLVCLPFDDPARRTPDLEDMRTIHDWSQGELTPDGFYPPELRALPAGGLPIELVR